MTRQTCIALNAKIKYTISTSTYEPHHKKYSPPEPHIQVCNKGINTILDLYGDNIYVGIYATLLRIYASNCLAKYAHGGRFECEVAFETTPNIIQLTHYTLRDPI